MTRQMRMALLSGLFMALANCTEAPDLAGVAADLETGTVGLGAARVPDKVAGQPFGQHVARAVMADPALTRTVADIRAARAHARAAEGAFRPALSVGVTMENRFRGEATARDTSPFARVSQLVYDAGAARAKQTTAQARVLQSRADQIQTGAQTTLAAVEAYKKLWTARRLLAVAQANLRVLRGISDQIVQRTESGAGSRADILTARSRVADARTRRVDAQAQLDRAETTFRRLFSGLPSDLPQPLKAPQLPSGFEDVLAQSPRLRAANARVKAAQAELAKARAERHPTVEAGATARQGSGGVADVGLDLTLNYSLDTRGARRAAIEAAAASVDQARTERDTLAREVRESLEFVRSDQAAGAARVAAARTAAETNAASLQAARDQFRIGRRDLVDLLDAQRDHVRAKATLIRAEQDRFLTDYAALALTGDILDVFRIDLPEVPQ